ncbi:cell division protein FtsL [Asticcacaulis excentricus]|uniref:Septum formation initiator n=1 Tax=Asticcacaulis excentricus (strain ATCC 15261 / DSM 4724 / KCTC 12464 / NCIMB 9791 / VKM B-1370 / CB 48) TaxID=573065 RepID=E8RRY4_ASTEC|nr:septum site-determining protein MinC [Asticcacaulis excentricus]ADU13509.1 Septum formation initiator [Asticcacaulis excentricus CB 48]
MKALMSLFDRRIRGVRLIEAIGLLLALIMIFWVCLSKVKEGQEVARLNALNAQIAEEQAAIKALKVKVANLEQPARIEALARQYLGMEPLSPKREAGLDNLVEISRSVARPEIHAAPPVTAVTAKPPAMTEEESAPIAAPVPATPVIGEATR